MSELTARRAIFLMAADIAGRLMRDWDLADRLRKAAVPKIDGGPYFRVLEQYDDDSMKIGSSWQSWNERGYEFPAPVKGGEPKVVDALLVIPVARLGVISESETIIRTKYKPAEWHFKVDE